MNTAPSPVQTSQVTGGLSRWIPRLIFAAATLHMLIGAVASAEHWRGIAVDGVWNTVAATDEGRMKALWFMISGLSFIALGLHARRSLITSRHLPAETAWTFVLLGIPISIMEPASGGWLLLLIGILAIVTIRHDQRTAAQQEK